VCRKTSANVDGGPAEGLVCADPGVRTPITISVSGNILLFLNCRYGNIYSHQCEVMNILASSLLKCSNKDIRIGATTIDFGPSGVRSGMNICMATILGILARTKCPLLSVTELTVHY
jgi:hypothetical protein